MKFGPSSIYIAFTKLHNTIEGHFWEDLISSHDIFFQAKGLTLVRANIDLQFLSLLWFLCLFLPVVFESLTNIKILRMRVTYLLTFLYILPWFSAQNAPPGARAVQTDPSFKSFSCTKHWKSFTGEWGSSSSSRRPCFPYYALTWHQNIRWKSGQTGAIYICIEVIMIYRPPCQRHDKGQKKSGPWAGEGQRGQAEEEAGQGAQEDGEEGAPAETTFRVWGDSDS